jgi:ribonuclease T1
MAIWRAYLLVLAGLWLGLLAPASPAMGWLASPGDSQAIQAGDLPSEGRQTLALIRQGGPFPYAKDGTVFRNREGLLPKQPGGYYREYTVPTPGAPNRGARRIVAGEGGEFYYTADHYRSFRRILETAPRRNE